MNTSIGPHRVLYFSPDGINGEIQLLIQPAPDRSTMISGNVVTDKEGSIQITSPWFNRPITLTADDDLQLAFRAMKAADSYVQKVCADNRYFIQKYFPGDVKGAFGIY